MKENGGTGAKPPVNHLTPYAGACGVRSDITLLLFLTKLSINNNMRSAKKKKTPISKEFTDEDGKKWIQTSTDDLFSVDEISSIIESIEDEKDSSEIVLARIDFQKVNKEYYEKVNDLQQKLKKRNDLLKKLLLDAKDNIDKKNIKLKELIDYIRKLHTLLAYSKLEPGKIEVGDIMPDKLFEPEKPEVQEDVVVRKKIDFTEVEEIMLDDQGEETGKIAE